MGTSESKNKRKLEKDQQLEDSFKTLSKGTDKIQQKDLTNSWRLLIDDLLLSSMENMLFDQIGTLEYGKYSSLFLTFYKGSLDEKIDSLIILINYTNPERSKVNAPDLHAFVEGIILSNLKLTARAKLPSYQSWNKRQCDVDKANIKLFSNYIVKDEKLEYNKEDLRPILLHLDLFINNIFINLYNYQNDSPAIDFLPRWLEAPGDKNKSFNKATILDFIRIIFINMELPVDFQEEWKFLYSTEVHGESFSSMCGEIVNKGASIIIIEDKDGHVFGGFAPDSFNIGSNFAGNCTSFLFTLYPHMNIYPTTGFDNNYQYLNSGQKTIPNGLGMGGKFEYFGLWIDAEFGRGHCSESCTTFKNYKMLSKQKFFDIRHLEVWAVGPPPPSAEELGERSVLDSNLEAKVMLQMAGKKMYSDGMREEKQTD